MKKIGIFLLLAGMGITAGAQSAKEKDAQKFAATITAEDLKEAGGC